MAKLLKSPDIASVPATVEFDFESYRAQLEEYIADYNIVVTSDTVADSKKAATELNKLSTEISSALREHEKKIEAPAKELSGYRKQLIDMVQKGRSEILVQVAKFEEVTLSAARELLQIFLQECRDAHSIEDDFHSADIESLVKLTAVNKDATKLTKSARDAVEAMVTQESLTQTRTHGRIASLEAESYKAGLLSPLTERHVSSFLHASDDAWRVNLQAVIGAELDRQRVTEQAAKERAERDAQAEMNRRIHEQAAKEDRQELPSAPVHEEPVPAAAGSQVVRVHAYFDVTVPAHVNPQDVLAKVGDRLAAQGVKATKVWL